uniref:Sulfate Permease (SulP) Family putative n=1 Tax=Albugo laibachii Nc14 TaxID=890382 RepID=F0WD38_9STRA|nr:Sulfate Permease (SulP) Family putative [Albugo laibachii Nc14]|eukprot:CCA19110.1 Sulfate Permease (SulP) Family putative [Albugo laibachii Nc14]
MSFADIANDHTSEYIENTVEANGLSTFRNNTQPGKSSTNQNKQALETATFKLEQFQRQTIAIKRLAGNVNSINEDVHDRIRFAMLLQGEITDALQRIPQTPSHTLVKRKFCKDFQIVSNQLEAAVKDIAAFEQKQQQNLKRHLIGTQLLDEDPNCLQVEHDGQTLEFQALEQDIVQNEAIIEEREKDIAKIHRSVAQVNEIFRDLAAIVEEQQVTVDMIETNVGETLVKTKQGLDQVRKAADSQRTCAIQ